MLNKSLWLGIGAGLLTASLFISFSYLGGFSLLDNPPAASTSVPTDKVTASTSPSIESELPLVTPKPIATAKPIVKSSPKPTNKPTPTPTPKPMVDYYVKDHSQILIPEQQIDVTEYVETQTVSRQRLEVDFAANNVSIGDTVLLRIYEDGNVKKEETRTVASTDNFHFAEVYYPKQYAPGSHTVRLVFNENHAVPESNYNNNDYTFTYKIIAESTPPTFNIRGPEIIDGQTCFTWENLEDNKSVYTDVWAKWKIDGGNWSSQSTGTTWGCITGMPGSSHTYYVHAEDFRGNTREESKTFTLY